MMTRWTRLAALHLAILGFLAFPALAQGLENTAVVKDRLAYYHDSGQYQSEVEKVMQQAECYLQERIKSSQSNKPTRKLAVVLDIDETSLSNYAHIKKIDFARNTQRLRPYLLLADGTPIKPTLKLFKLAIHNNVSVFFITGRNESIRTATISNLNNAGYSGWKGLYFKPSTYQGSSVVAYKSGVRKKITEEGYDIILNIGDQRSDLEGGYADRSFKLPNPYYTVS